MHSIPGGVESYQIFFNSQLPLSIWGCPLGCPHGVFSTEKSLRMVREPRVYLRFLSKVSPLSVRL